MKLRSRHIARNVLANSAGTIVGMAVGFFLSPFVLHRLGDVAYGVWVLAVSVVGYLQLLDMGMQGSILRFVSQGYTRQDHAFSSDAASAAFWVRSQIACFAVVISVAIAFVFPKVFKIPGTLATDAQITIVLIGITTAATMTFGVFGGVIAALNRYDLQNYASLTQTFVRVVAIVYVLRTGHGIVAIAVCELLAVLIMRALQIVFVRRLYPQLRLRFRSPDRSMLKKIWSYSAYVFLVMVATQLVYQTDNVVVGAFISTAAVTFYAIANSLCRYANQTISSMSNTFMPAASTFEASGDQMALLKLYKNGTRAMIAVALPMMLTLIIRGSTFIGLWMGPQYAHISGTILVILGIPIFFVFVNQTAVAIAFGTENHRRPAIWAISEGVANLGLSIILVHFYGLYGVAIGTLVPSLISQLGFWPRYTARFINLSPSRIVFGVWAPIILAGVPFGLASYAFERFLPPHSMIGFIMQVLVTLPVFLLTVGLLFRSLVTTQVIPRLRAMFLTQAV